MTEIRHHLLLRCFRKNDGAILDGMTLAYRRDYSGIGNCERPRGCGHCKRASTGRQETLKSPAEHVTSQTSPQTIIAQHGSK